METGNATYVDRRVHINTTSEIDPKPVLDEEEYLHVLGVVMAQQFILKARLKNCCQ